MLNCDVLFHPQLLHDLLTARHDAALMLAYRQPDDPPFGDEEMKVKVRGGRVVDMSKAMDPAESDGENVGMLRFDAAPRRCSSRSSKPSSAAAGGEIGRPGRLPRLPPSGPCTRSGRGDTRGRKSISRRTISARCATSFRRSRRLRSSGHERPVEPPRVSRCGRPVSDVHERFYQLRELPFALSPDPDYLYRAAYTERPWSYLRSASRGRPGSS